ncbi:unnamed protein product [Moneuplotes crassus]|uniref:EamA domain-containing protein n=1 Tax=Euplotes crassus TaxID=5936 RepID=A0AAD1XJV6_EUPCR|nr:unnamed protein product [Moneuplotes crassus]
MILNSPSLGILLAVVSIICSSAILPSMNSYKGVSVAMMGLWRSQLSCIYCIPITWYLLRKLPKIDAKVFTWTTVAEIVAGSTLFCCASTMFLFSSKFTLYSHTMVLANSGGVFLIIINVLRLLPVNRLEVIGTIAVIIGIISLINDSKSTKGEGETNVLLGDILALLSMPLFTMAYFYNARAIKNLPSLVVFHCFSAVHLVLYMLYLLISSNSCMKVLFSRDDVSGMFGWSNSEHILLSLFIIGPICGVIGLGCYVFLLDFFPPHIVNGVFLMEPFTGQLIGCILGQDDLPSAFTYIGAFFVTLGLGLSIFGDIKKSQSDNGNTKTKLEIELSDNSLL